MSLNNKRYIVDIVPSKFEWHLIDTHENRTMGRSKFFNKDSLQLLENICDNFNRRFEDDLLYLNEVEKYCKV